MVKIIFGIFLILHGLVHLLYFGQGMRLFELPGLAWPDAVVGVHQAVGAGLRQDGGRYCLYRCSCHICDCRHRLLRGCILVAVANLIAVVFSTLIWILFWDGTLHNLSGQGLYAILINIGIFLAARVFHWPE